MEDHGFVEPSSWTDEYKRILKLFEENLKEKTANWFWLRCRKFLGWHDTNATQIFFRSKVIIKWIHDIIAAIVFWLSRLSGIEIRCLKIVDPASKNGLDDISRRLLLAASSCELMSGLVANSNGFPSVFKGFW